MYGQSTTSAAPKAKTEDDEAGSLTISRSRGDSGISRMPSAGGSTLHHSHDTIEFTVNFLSIVVGRKGLPSTLALRACLLRVNFSSLPPSYF